MIFSPLTSTDQLLEFINEHDLNLLDQAKSYNRRYVDALKILHDQRDESDDWYLYGSKCWGFLYTFGVKFGRYKVHRMVRVGNKNINHGKTKYVPETKILESWDKVKGVEHLMQSAYMDLREAFIIINTKTHWISLYEDKAGKHFIAEQPRGTLTLSDICHQTRENAKGVKNYGFSE